MARLTVIEPGMLTTVQDGGRFGHAAMGVPESGAADALALRIGNRMVGNAAGAAALEMTLMGGTFAFERDAVVSLAGGNTRAVLESGSGVRPAGLGAMRVGAGERLRVGPVVRGVRTYLCVRGGIAVPAALGSCSTCLAAAFGGLDGRALRKGDVLSIGDAAAREPVEAAPVAAAVIEETLSRRTLRAVDGAQAAEFDDGAARRFWSSAFTVSSRSDRVGIRLEGSIGEAGAGRMRSEGMPCGAVQVPPGGEPIALMVDHPTTGGYPVIACVASVDLPVLGQLRPGDTVRFERVTQAVALAALAERERVLATWEARP